MGLQPCRHQLNAELMFECRQHASCFLLDADKIFQEAIAQGTIRDLFQPDMLHLSRMGSELLRDEILDLIN